MNNRKGFTLIEVVVILTVLAILAAIAVPIALRILQVTAEDATRHEMANLKNAMIGDPRKIQSSFRSDFGFLGDMGRLPANLDELLVRGSLPAFAFESSKQAGAGWKGPYITGAAAGEAAEAFKTDQWGHNYIYSDEDFTNADGQLADGKIASAGPDGTFDTADDIVIEILKNETTATVRGKVKDTAGAGLAAVPVEFYFPVNGRLTTITANADANGEYVFASVPFGPRSVQAKPRLVLSPASVTQGRGGRDVSLRVINYSESAYTITQIRVNFDPVGGNYDEIKINGRTVDSANNFTSGQDVTIASTTVATSQAARPSERVFIDSPDTQLADITISGQGTSAAIEINNFRNSVTGTSMTVAFNPNGDKSVVAFLVP